ncbi:MAG TPA: outer membrane beta-barrel protein [Nitrospira sp.]|nr:outer membrane beta-barrel protein [Nitrospira sp.]
MLRLIVPLTGLIYLLLAIFAVSDSLAERNWEFSIAGFGGKAFHSNQDIQVSQVNLAGGGTGFDTTVHGVQLNDSGTFGAKLTAWYLPRQYNWQPQIGLQLDFTRYTADLNPQTQGAGGATNIPGFQVGSITFGSTRDVSVDTLAANLLFRYPIWPTDNLPQGRIAPYVGIGVGIQRAALTAEINGHKEIDYSPAGQLLAGMNFFLMRNVAIFGEYKRIWSTHDFTYSADIAPPGYEEKWHMATNIVAGGVALHF